MLKSLIALTAGLLAVLATACGSGGNADSAASQPSASAANTVEVEQASGATNGMPSSAGDGPGAGGAVVTIGDDEFEFELTGVCATFYGQVSAISNPPDAEVTANFTIPPEDWATESDHRWDPPRVTVLDTSSEPNVEWRALGDPSSATDKANRGSVDSYTIDGPRAHGTATFHSVSPKGEIGFVSEDVAGTFDVECGS